jgi:hypothetical protein
LLPIGSLGAKIMIQEVTQMDKVLEREVADVATIIGDEVVIDTAAPIRGCETALEYLEHSGCSLLFFHDIPPF